jgi:hypothetical protein
MRTDSRCDALEAWVDEAIQRCASRGLLPGRFPEMRKNLGTAPAIARLMNTPFERTPLRRLKQAGLIEWSLEAGVLRFPDCFGPRIRDAAQFRLDHVDDASLR